MITAVYESKKYREAITKEDQCKVHLYGWENHPKPRKEYQEYCPKSKSNNIISCPKKIINREKKEGIQWINDYFKNFGKRSKKEKTKKKRKERRNKKKKIKKKKSNKKQSKKKKSNKKKSKKKKSNKKTSKMQKSNKKKSKKKNAAKLYGDALYHTAVFIDWLDWFRLIRFIELIKLIRLIPIQYLIVLDLMREAIPYQPIVKFFF